MPRNRTQQTDLSSEDDGCEVTARRVIEKQKQQQNRRRSKGRGAGSSTRTSLWSTIAATRIDKDKPYFRCCVCGFRGSTNQNFSSSNISNHYKAKHKATHAKLLELNASNATQEMLLAAIQHACNKHNRVTACQTIDQFLVMQRDVVPSSDSLHSSTQFARIDVSVNTLQSVALVLYSCVTETPISRVATPITQGVIDIFNGRMQVSSKTQVDKYFIPTYNAVCKILRDAARSSLTGCLTLDGWSAALGAPILGVTWHFIDCDWNLKSVPIVTLNMGDASKSGEQMRCIVDEVLKESSIIGSDDISIHTITSDNEAATALAVDLLTNYVGSVRCVVHTLALCVNDVFVDYTPWSNYLSHVNKVTTYFNQHPKAAMLLQEKQQEAGVSQDRIHRLRREIPTRWHSRLGAMLTYLTEVDNISKVVEQLSIEPSQVPSLSVDQRNTLAEFICVLAEVRRVSRQLEADRKVTMSRAPRLLRELFETLRVMSGVMCINPNGYYSEHSLNNLDTDSGDIASKTLPAIPSCAPADKERDEARSQRLRKASSRQLATQLADRIAFRLGSLWNRVDPTVANWRPEEQSESMLFHDDSVHEPDTTLRAPRRVLLFHIAAILDVNECELDFLDCSSDDKESYFKVLHEAVTREAFELGDISVLPQSDLEVVFGLFHSNMRANLRGNGRRLPSAALHFWKEANMATSVISPVPFNKVARACLSSQASSASAERLFSDLGRLEGRQQQSLLSSTLQMTEMIRVFVMGELQQIRLPQSNLLHPKAASFKQIVQEVAIEVVKGK